MWEADINMSHVLCIQKHRDVKTMQTAWNNPSKSEFLKMAGIVARLEERETPHENPRAVSQGVGVNGGK